MATVIIKPGRNNVIRMAFELHAKAQRAEKRKAKSEPAIEEPPPAPARKAKPRPKPKKKPADKTMLAHAKENVSQNGTYMAIVRRLACRRCTAPPPSPKKGNEFCHRDEGKGMGLKTDVREGWAGCPACHKEVGEGKMPRAEKRRLNDEYAESTRDEVIALGLWPKTLAKWKEKA